MTYVFWRLLLVTCLTMFLQTLVTSILWVEVEHFALGDLGGHFKSCNSWQQDSQGAHCAAYFVFRMTSSGSCVKRKPQWRMCLNCIDLQASVGAFSCLMIDVERPRPRWVVSTLNWWFWEIWERELSMSLGSKTVGSIPPRLFLQFCLPISRLEFLPWLLSTMDCDWGFKTFLALGDFGEALCPTNRNWTKTLSYRAALSCHSSPSVVLKNSEVFFFLSPKFTIILLLKLDRIEGVLWIWDKSITWLRSCYVELIKSLSVSGDKTALISEIQMHSQP